MTSHPWLAPPLSLVQKVARARCVAVLRGLQGVHPNRLGAHGLAWSALIAALPALLRADRGRLLDAVGRVDVLSVLLELAAGPVAAERLERALVTLWLGIAGHPGLTAPLALPGPSRTLVIDPATPRLLDFSNVRGLVATANGLVVIGIEGRQSIDARVAAALPSADGTVIIDAQWRAPDAAVVAKVRAALTRVGAALPGGRLERVTIGSGDAVFGEARVGAAADSADLVASAHGAFVRAAAALDPVLGPGGVLIEHGRPVTPADVLARACGNAVALPWRTGRSAAAEIARDCNDLAILADPTPAGRELLGALRALSDGASDHRRHALLVNVDADDFVYSFQFGRSIERRCVERDLRVDRIAIATDAGRDLAAELGEPVPAAVADGTELLLDSEQDASQAAALRRLSARRYEVVVTNVRPRLFYDLMAAGLFAAPTLVWDRHLHGGLREEAFVRGFNTSDIQKCRMEAWSLADKPGQGLHPHLVDVGFVRGSCHVWPMDLDFFRSAARCQPGRLFAGGDSARDWPVLIDAVRDLPFDVHLVTAQPPADMPANVRVEARLPLWQFRDAMAAATVTAIPLIPNIAAGVTVLPMAMALGVAVVATRTQWTEHYARDGEEALLVPAGDVHAFRSALLRLSEDDDLRTRLVANARRRVAALCDLEAFTREMFATLDERRPGSV